MIGEAIRFVFRDFPAVMLVLALLIAAINPKHQSVPERFLAWILLLPIGLTGLWSGAFHIFLPSVASADIGWQASPFEFEVGMADLAIGITACVAFSQDLSFKAAAVVVASVFLLGDAVGHVHQMLAAGNFSPGNAGVPFYTDIICPILAIVFTPRRTRETLQQQSIGLLRDHSR
jgi:hypothetical protein